ncbi:hypothetical protein HJC23_008151 [Cyclotella cryptica]|uniref:Uncharacterized protein n=1 Tax=Cyclotella cryptica TaxID=29204 RepID=A0ABD3PKA3_9STRA|eukprot:CCRYP_013994-RA/>CCRYP_013994-RA protein AED:0.01 eAED:0.01 QI:1618/1/1/1/0.5/0.33/3/1379/126
MTLTTASDTLHLHNIIHHNALIMAPEIDRSYTCRVDLALPSTSHAQLLQDVLSVDGELGNKIAKSFAIVAVSSDEHEVQDSNEGTDMRVLRIDFEAADAKMLRVAVSTMYDMIIVALKCFQEFGSD